MEEIWKPIKNYEGYYEISNLGRVKSLDRFIKQKDHFIHRRECIKQSRIDFNGYYVVTLCKDRKSVSTYIHRLLAEAFIPNPDNKPCVDHINTITTDNSLENLRLVTAEENSNNCLTLKHFKEDANKETSIKRRLLSRKQNKTKTGPKTIYQYTILGEFINEHFSIVEAAHSVQCSPSYVRRILDTNKSFKNYLFTSKIKGSI